MKDVEIRLPDRPGALAGMARALGKAGIGIEGGGAWVVDGRGVGHFLFADDAPAAADDAADGLAEAGFDDRSPGHETETDAVVEQREAAAREQHTAAIGS